MNRPETSELPPSPSEVPRIDVAMPARNAERWIGAALESVIDQRGVDLHVFVVDDASDDRTADIAARFAGPRVTLLTNDARRGIGACHNRVVEAGSATLIAHVDADDVIEPGALLELATAVTSSPSVGQAYCDFFPIDEGGVSDPELRASWAGLFEQVRSGPIDYPRELVAHGMVVSALRTYRREAIERVGPFDESLPWAVDYEMALRIAEDYDFAHVPKMLYGRRLHGGGASQNPRGRALRHWWMRARLVRRQLNRRGGRLLGHNRWVTMSRLARALPPVLIASIRPGSAP